jgi:neutral ceramidase
MDLQSRFWNFLLPRGSFFVIAGLTFAFFSAEGIAAGALLKAGIAKVDITPAKPVVMGGYGLRIGPSTGIYAPIFVRALVFDDGAQRVALIESDVVDYGQHLEIRKRISEATGIPLPGILLAAVHNHSAPDPASSKIDPEWKREFVEKIILAVKQAVASLVPVRLGGNTGHSRIGMNRRKKVDAADSITTFDENYFSQSFGKYKTDHPVKIREIEGVIRLGSNPEGPIDDEVGILRIDSISGKPLAVFVNYACHGTSLGARNSLISPEWNGHMLQYVEEKVPGVVGIFAIGAAGDINPRFVGGLEGYRDDLENTKKLGFEIGQEVASVFNSTPTAELADPKIKMVSQEISLPRNYRDLPDDFTRTTVSVPVSVVKIGDFTWVTLPVELFHEIGKRIKACSHSKFPFIVTCCNDDLGYLPTQKAFSEGGYEPAGSHFDPISEQVLVRKIADLMVPLDR